MKSTAPKRQRFQGGVRAFFRMRAEQNHGKRSAAHDQAQRLHAVHARHFQIQCDDVGTKLFDLFQRECAVHRRAHHFDRGIAGEDRRDELPHERRIIDNENADLFAHAMAPSGSAEKAVQTPPAR